MPTSARLSPTISAAAAPMCASWPPSSALPASREREAIMNVNVSRRDLLKGSGALVVSFSLVQVGDALAQGAAPAKPVALTDLDSFLAIDARGSVLVYSG